MEHARRILEEADQISALVRLRHGTLTSVLRLGIIPTLSPYILPLLLTRLHQAFPDLRLVLREDLTDHLLDALDAFALDVLLIALPEQGAAYRSMPLFREPFCFACPTEHALANRPVVTERELAQEFFCCSTKAIACATRHWRCAVTSRRTATLPETISARPAWRRYPKWLRQASAAHCCRPWPCHT